MRFYTRQASEVTREREYRMIPSERWMSALGVTPFDKVPSFLGDVMEITRVEIPISKHIGAPSIPTVKDGDAVKRGDVIAEAQDGLSVPQHASVDGRVTVDKRKIIIDRY